MTREEAIIKLKKLQDSCDIEVAHLSADNVLSELLKTLGYEDVVKEYYKVDKWYA